MVVVHHKNRCALRCDRNVEKTDLLALNGGGLALLNGLLRSLALLEKGLRDQDLLGGGGGTKEPTVSTALH